MSIGVFLADDQRLLREALGTLLESRFDVRIVGETADGKAVVSAVLETNPNVLLLDVTLPGASSVEATRLLCTQRPGLGVVGISSRAHRGHMEEMLAAGARGFVLDSEAAEELVTAVLTVALGERYISPGAASAIESPTREGGSICAPLGLREREVLKLLADGKTSKEIAALLHISVRTVEAHRRNIMKKLDLHSVAALTKFAVREGLTSLE